LSVESVPDEGSTFTVKLYLANVGGDQEDVVEADIIGYQGQAKRLLVVDDQPDHRQLLRNILEPIGFIVEEAINGKDCLAIAADNPADLILLDLNMPELDGYDAAYQLRSDNITTPIIVLTADAYPADQIRAINAGCNDFLAKPIKVPDLLGKLKLQLGLEWLHGEPEAELPALSQINSIATEVFSSAQPPQAIVQELTNYARIGDLHGLNCYLEEIAGSQPTCMGFLGQVETLSKAYKLSELKKLLEQSTITAAYVD